MKLWRRLMRPTLFAVLGACLLSQSAFAQFSSGNTASRTTTGTTGAAGTGASGNSAGASGTGGMFGSGQGASSSGLGQTGQAGNAQNRQINAQSQLGLNQNAFLGQGNNQQNFVGRNPRNQTQGNQQNRQNNNNRGGQGNFGQNDPNNQNGQGQQNQDPKRAIRPQFKVAFDELPRPTTEIRSTLQPRFDSLSQTPALSGVAYELDAEGVVVLRGTVDTPSQRRLAENVVKLEPGVKKVRNELTLNEPATTK